MDGFDNRTAIFLAAVCSQTYAQYNDPKGEFVVPRPYEPIGEIHARSLTGGSERFGFVLQSETHVIIAFRGTSTTSDWVSDAMASQVNYRWADHAGMSHRGFSNIYRSARDGILGLLKGINTDKAMYVTGHSLGGALATLCGMDMAANTEFRSPAVYSFASPRVGDPDFAGAFQSKVGRSYRVHNRFDVVPLLPPAEFSLPKRNITFHYEHVRNSEQLAFHNDSVPGNHAIGSYYAELAKRDPLFAESLSAANPGFCPKTVISSSGKSDHSDSV